MRNMSPLRAALALLPCALLCSALAGACSSSGAPTLASPEGNPGSGDGAADVASPGTEGGISSVADGQTVTSGDAANSEGDATVTGQDSSTSPTDANTSTNPGDDARVLYEDASEFPETGSFDATVPCSNRTCDGPNAAPTCCASDGTCVASSDTTCGYAGFPCVDCTATSQTCGTSSEYVRVCQ
jgi:hypothetical protein